MTGGLLIAALLSVLLISVGTARAEFGITSFDGAVSANRAGDPYTQAGGHPFAVSTDIDFNTHSVELFPGVLFPAPDADVKTISVDLPPGLTGNPQAVEVCELVDFFLPADGTGCPYETQVGVSTIRTPASPYTVPVYSITPPDSTVPAAFGFDVAGVRVVLNATVRSDSDYGITVSVPNINQGLEINGTSLTIWGTPADSVHDDQRCKKLIGDMCIGTPGTDTGPNALTTERKTFMTLPTSCTGPGIGLRTTLHADPWTHPGVFETASFVSHLPPGYPLPSADWGAEQGPTGCEKVPFNPAVDVQPTSRQASTPTGLDVYISMPQDGLATPGAIATAHLRRATVTLPVGVSISPAAADGLQACSDAQAAVGTAGDPQCPDASKIGTVTVDTPVLSEQLKGGIYVAAQKSSDPESGQMFRVLLTAKGAGVTVKLVGQVRADGRTGQLTATFDNNPQLPFTDLHVRFKGGPRAPLVNPATCGAETIDAQLTSWSGKTVDRQSTFAVDCAPGLGGFAPSVAAGTVSPVAGVFSPFVLDVIKPDGNADVNGLSMVLPTGLLAKLKGNVGTQVGTVKAFAGPGSNPFMLPGKVFLEGRYGDAPFSLRVVVPAKAGPFDLGDVVVRQRIYVDPIDAHVTVVSDPIPTIVKGVPVRLQRLDVNVDKPNFIINPTSCAAKEFGGTLGAVGGQSAPINVRFQVGECGSLALKPVLELSLSGKGQTRDGGHPAISATLSQPAGGANLKKVRVALPSSVALDPDNAASEGLCSFIEGSKPLPVCPASSVVGRATAVSPILNEPLSGPVYFVKNERKDPKSGRSIKTTPKLVIPLTGENGVKLTLTGVSSVPDNVHLVTTFDAIPDAPVSSFKLDINGGKKGILVVSSADICKSTQIADQQVDGQNGKAADADVFIQTPSCPLKVISKVVGKSSVAVKVGGLAAGKAAVTGKGIKKTTKTITKSTVATITARRTKGTPGKVTVSFDPTGPAKAHKITK